MIAENIPRPEDLARRGRNFEFGLEHDLVIVVARTQHHPVLAERDRLRIMVCRDVSDGENRHCGPALIQVADNASFDTRQFPPQEQDSFVALRRRLSRNANANEWNAV
jgi:hypothetical protein